LRRRGRPRRDEPSDTRVTGFLSEIADRGIAPHGPGARNGDQDPDRRATANPRESDAVVPVEVDRRRLAQVQVFQPATPASRSARGRGTRRRARRANRGNGCGRRCRLRGGLGRGARAVTVDRAPGRGAVTATSDERAPAGAADHGLQRSWIGRRTAGGARSPIRHSVVARRPGRRAACPGREAHRADVLSPPAALSWRRARSRQGGAELRGHGDLPQGGHAAGMHQGFGVIGRPGADLHLPGNPVSATCRPDIRPAPLRGNEGTGTWRSPGRGPAGRARPLANGRRSYLARPCSTAARSPRVRTGSTRFAPPWAAPRA